MHLPLWGKLLLASSFNDHVIHHLFPTIDLSKQHLVRPVLEKYCKEEKVCCHALLRARIRRYQGDCAAAMQDVSSPRLTAMHPPLPS